MKEMKRCEYDAILREDPDDGGADVVFPRDLREEFGRGRLKVHASFDGIPYNRSRVNMGVKNADGSICDLIGVRKAIRQKLGKKNGDAIRLPYDRELPEEMITRLAQGVLCAIRTAVREGLVCCLGERISMPAWRNAEARPGRCCWMCVRRMSSAAATFPAR